MGRNLTIFRSVGEHGDTGVGAEVIDGDREFWAEERIRKRFCLALVAWNATRQFQLAQAHLAVPPRSAPTSSSTIPIIRAPGVDDATPSASGIAATLLVLDDVACSR